MASHRRTGTQKEGVWPRNSSQRLFVPQLPPVSRPVEKEEEPALCGWLIRGSRGDDSTPESIPFGRALVFLRAPLCCGLKGKPVGQPPCRGRTHLAGARRRLRPCLRQTASAVAQWPTWRGSRPKTRWLWVKHMYPKWNPGKWKHGLKPAVS